MAAPDILPTLNGSGFAARICNASNELGQIQSLQNEYSHIVEEKINTWERRLC
jgi:hypothetical protein